MKRRFDGVAKSWLPRLWTAQSTEFVIYDVATNRGLIYLGKSGDTAAFAADAVATWWQTEGRASYATKDELLLLADAGGSNSCHTRAWKERLQAQVCDRFGLTVTVCHYPTGCPKWNPIEHRLFSQISCNWAGVPLRTWDTVLGFIRGTKTSSGLAVKAVFQPGDYPTGKKVTDAEMKALNLQHHAVARPGTTRSDPGLRLEPHRDSGNLFLDTPLARSLLFLHSQWSRGAAARRSCGMTLRRESH